MNKPLTLTERAVVKLNHIALTLHHLDVKRRRDRLIGRLTGERVGDKAMLWSREGNTDAKKDGCSRL